MWNAQLGTACIDVSICSRSSTLAIADVSHGVIVTDIDGRVIMKRSLPCPVWGVDHRLRTDGKLLLAVAGASKQPRFGKVCVFIDDETIVDFDLNSPAWDTIILEDESVVASSWNGSCYHWSSDMTSSPTSITIDQGKPIFGLHAKSGGGYYANIENVGIYAVNSTSTQFELTLPLRNNAYNIALSMDSTLLSSCGYGPAISLLNLSTERIINFVANEVRAASFIENILVVGDAVGRVTAWNSSAPDAPVFTTHLEADIWAAAHCAASNILTFALGNGHVYCFRPVLL